MILNPQQDARAALIARLTAVHGLDADQAAAAVDHVHAHQPHEHADLVHAAARELVAEGLRPVAESMTRAWQALRPTMARVGQHVHELAGALAGSDHQEAADV